MSEPLPRRDLPLVRFLRTYPERELADLMLDVMRTNLANAAGWPPLDLTPDHQRWLATRRGERR